MRCMNLLTKYIAQEPARLTGDRHDMLGPGDISRYPHSQILKVRDLLKLDAIQYRVHPLEKYMICLAASKLTSFSYKLYHSLRIRHFVEFTSGWLAWKFWCQLSDENPSSPGHLPHPHSTAHFYPTLIPKTR